jgi:hypothetical protein
MTKPKTPLELIAHFKNTETKKEDGSEMSDTEKRKDALKARHRNIKTKKKKTTKIS